MPNNTATHPADCNRILLAALEAGDIETSVALYEADAVLFRRNGSAMTGLEAIRKNNAAMIALKPVFTIEFIKATVSADGAVATNRMKASFAGTDAKGQPVRNRIHTLEVVRKQADGTWRYVIDDPFGSMRDGMEESAPPA